MNPAPTKDLLDYIQAGCSEVLSRVAERVQEHEEAVHKARRSNREEPKADLPNVSKAHWVNWAAGILDQSMMPAWIRDRDLRQGFDDLAGPVLARLRDLREFATWEAEPVEVRWSRKSIVARDLVLTDALAGRVKVVPLADRLAWSGEGPPPSFRLELSLPWWLLATEDEQERGLHHVLSACGMKGGGEPVLRKPDIVAHASTLARYGVSGIRQAMAVAHAQAHPSHERLLRDYGFDPVSGQGMLWRDHHEPRQTNLVDQARAAKRKKAPKLAAVTDLPDEPAI